MDSPPAGTAARCTLKFYSDSSRPEPAGYPSAADMAIQIAIPHRAGKLSVQWPGNDPEGCARFLRELLK